MLISPEPGPDIFTEQGLIGFKSDPGSVYSTVVLKCVIIAVILCVQVVQNFKDHSSFILETIPGECSLCVRGRHCSDIFESTHRLK